MTQPDPFATDAKHPDEVNSDLNPNFQAGQNFGQVGDQNSQQITAHDIKELHGRYPELHSDDLKQIAIMLPGSRLETKAAYLDLHSTPAREFHALGDETVSEDDWIVPKKGVDYQLWNRLKGIEDPERTGEADES